MITAKPNFEKEEKKRKRGSESKEANYFKNLSNF